jgi:crotonobetaine/carnitine-CoA ligase
MIDRADRHADTLAVGFEQKVVTCGEAVERASAVGNALTAMGVQAADRVAIMLPNGLEFLDTYFGLAAIAGAAVPVNIAQRGETLRHILEHSEAQVIVIDQELVGILDEAWPDHRLRMVVVGDHPPPGAVPFAELAAGSTALPEISIGDREPIGILYTSGTTGPPKGVVADGYDLEPARILLGHVGAQPGETVYTCLPLFHGNALMLSAMGSIQNDWILRLGRKFSASRFWDEVRDSRAVSFTALGAMIPILLKATPSDTDRDHDVRTVISAACPAWVWREFEDRFGVRIVEFYGMVDSPGLLINAEGRVGAMGRAATDVEFQVVANDQPVPDGTVGELVFRHPRGPLTHYHRDPEASEQAYRGGWFHSGDLATRDTDGYFTYCGRLKESIRRRGENISAWEVETVVNQHPSVRESAAHAVPSELGEDDVKVVVVLEPGQVIDPASIVRFCQGRMADYAVPRYVDFRSELPKTETHRIRYQVLREQGIAEGSYDRENANA